MIQQCQWAQYWPLVQYSEFIVRPKMNSTQAQKSDFDNGMWFLFFFKLSVYNSYLQINNTVNMLHQTDCTESLLTI